MENTSSAPFNLFDRFNRWMRESIMVKLFSIGFLLLILLLPTAWIMDLMEERQYRAADVINEVSNKWSGSQTVSGPILVIPYKKREVIDREKEGKEVRESIENAYFLPDELNVTGRVDPQIRERGIFEAVVYQSKLDVQSTFKKPDFKILSIADEDVLWQEAKLVFGISDLRGISENPVITLGSEKLIAEPINDIGVIVPHHITPSLATEYAVDSTPTEDTFSPGIEVRPNWINSESFQGKIAVSVSLKGSKELAFVPVGKTTVVKLNGKWSDPSFVGEFLPDPRVVGDSTFDATWKVLHFNRPFSQQWAKEHQRLGADFGVKLLVPVDQYQKSIRTAKYAILMILLTFVALLLVEITQKIRIHPFQYILIGAALIIYYTLLLSFSEHIGYDWAYLVASISTVTLIGLYSRTFLEKKSLVILFSILLAIFYTFIFVIILQQDFSLLLGSIGLFVIVGLLMYFSRKVNWYGELKAES